MPSALLLLIHGCNNDVDEAYNAFERLQRQLSGQPDYAPGTTVAPVIWPAGSHVWQFTAAIRLVCFAGALATVQVQSPPDSRQLRQSWEAVIKGGVRSLYSPADDVLLPARSRAAFSIWHTRSARRRAWPSAPERGRARFSACRPRPCPGPRAR